jgi:Major tropism determinant N-terminal domain
MSVRIQLRRGTAAEWTTANPTLSDGEIGFESDTGKFKIGRSSTAWTSLAYATDLPSQIDGLLSDLSNTVTSHTSSHLNVHGISDTSALETKTGAQNKADSAYSSAQTYSDNSISTHNSTTHSVHGIANTAALETKTGAQTKADTAESNAKSYTDTALSGLVDSAPTLLNTLNELAAALNDDPAFATTVANSIATKATLVVDTSSNLTTANAAIAANTFVLESNTGKFKIGNGTTHWTALPYAGTTSTEIANLTTQLEGYADAMMTYHMAQTTNVHGIANVADLVVSSTLTNHTSSHLNVHGISNTALLVQQYDLDTHNSTTTNVHGIANTAALVTTSILATHASTTTNVHGIANTADLVITSDLSPITSDIATKAPLLNPTFTGTVVLPTTTSIGNTTSTEISYLHGVTSGIQTQLDAKAPTANATFTGTTSGITKAMVGLGNVDNTTDANKPISNATQVALDLKAPIANATLTGTVVLPSTTSIGSVSATEIGYIDGVTSSIQTQLDAKLASSTASSTYAPIANPNFTGTVSGVTKAMVGLGNVDNTTDANKPISTATQTALDLKAPLANATLTGTVVLPATTSIGTVSATEIGYVDGVTSSIQTQLNAKAPSDSPTFTGTVSGVTKAMVGLGNVDNTSDTNKPISTATQTALDLKAPIANATFTGTLTAPTISATDLTTANLTVTGTTTTVNSTNLAIADSVIYLADTQYAADAVDIGFYGAYGSVGGDIGNHKHTGLVRDHLDGVFKLFYNGTEPANATVDLTTVSYADLKIGNLVASGATIGSTTNTEIGYLHGVTSAIQTQLDAKAPLANPTFTGTVTLPANTVTSTMIADSTIVNADISASAAIAVSKLAASTISGVTLGSNLNALTIGTGLTGASYNGSAANTIAIDTSVVATLTGTQALTNKTITLTSGGATFSDGTVQVTAGVPSLTTISAKTASYTLAALTERDTIIEIANASATTLTIPLDSTLSFPVGTTIDIIQTSTGQVTIAGASGVTVNATPGLKLRTQWSSATLLKRAANTWLVYGDLSA